MTTAACPRAEPGYFLANDRACLRWLHMPAQASVARDVGVVICNPFGYEALCAHRSLRHLADACAAHGYPALRFDYDGTGDSAGDDLDPGRWPAWLASARGAVRELRQRSGVQRVVLLGVQLGASIAAAASVDEADVVGVALIAPIVNGRPWLRELRALQATMGRAAAPAEFAPPADVQESVGLQITPETRAALEAIDLGALGARLPRQVLLIDRDDRPTNEALLDRWHAEHCAVQHAVRPGYVQMMSDPHMSTVPTQIIDEVIGWLGTTLALHPASAAQDPTATDTTVGDMSVPVPVAPGVVERACLLDAKRQLFGVITLPEGARPTRAGVFLTAGANHHIGNGRMYVKLARRLAAMGWVVLRYDVSGIGDSLPHPSAPENEVYTQHAVEDFGAALQFLSSEYEPKRIEALGLCSGAYHAFKGAVAGLPVTGLTIVNPLVFFWQQGMSLAYPAYQMVQAAAGYRESMFRGDKWLKVLRGQVDVGEFAVVVTNRAGDRARSVAREVMRVLQRPVVDDLAAELSAIARRGVALRLIFSSGDPGEALLRSGAGRQLTRLEQQGKLSIDHMPDCDHSLSVAWMHEALWRKVSDALRDT